MFNFLKYLGEVFSFFFFHDEVFRRRGRASLKGEIMAN